MSTSLQTPWAAPFAAHPVDANVVIPSSKSITNRALLLAALADGPSTITGPLVARDTQLMTDALRAIGTSIVEDDGIALVTPQPLAGPASIDCGLAGTVMRFVPPVAALAHGDVRFDGDPWARERPMGELLRALQSLGVVVTTASGPTDRLPFTIQGAGSVAGGVVTLDASASSQFVSALLLAGARYTAGLDLRHDGKPMPSAPHVEMTVAMLRERGVEVDDSEPNRWLVAPSGVAARNVTIEPDLSNAAPFLAAAAATRGRVTVADWPAQTTQPGDQLRDILALMGCDMRLDAHGLTVTGPAKLAGVDLDLHDVGELTPVIAALAALSDGPSHLRGIAHLRGHETDRLAALVTELSMLGCDAREMSDGLEIRPRPLVSGVFKTYADHRMAHAAAVIGLVVQGIRLDDVATTSKTFPGFVDAWTAMLA